MNVQLARERQFLYGIFIYQNDKYTETIYFEE